MDFLLIDITNQIIRICFYKCIYPVSKSILVMQSCKEIHNIAIVVFVEGFRNIVIP